MCSYNTVPQAKKNVQRRRGSAVASADDPGAWVDRELPNSKFKDARLGRRFRSLLEQLSSSAACDACSTNEMLGLHYTRLRANVRPAGE